MAFTSFDTDCDGYLTAAELRAVRKSCLDYFILDNDFEQAVKRSVKNGRRLIQAQVKRIGEEEGLPAPASRVMSSVWARVSYNDEQFGFMTRLILLYLAGLYWTG